MKTFYEMLKVLSEESYDREKDARAMGFRSAEEADKYNWGNPADRGPNANTGLESNKMYYDDAEDPKTLEEFVKFVNNMKDPVVLKWRKDDTWFSANFLKDPDNYINLKDLVKDAGQYRNIKEFWHSLNLSHQEHKIISNTITGLLRQGLPLSVINAFASGELR